jgi:3-isopropylmalate/(R)-2-methylmalate dehydratase small subunit
MAYEKFKILKSKCVPLPIENVDTDQIIPARFLKATERVGFGDNLFRDWKFNADNSPKKDFVLNNQKFNGKILIGGKNFGSGSSREHAAWAIYDYGFRCVISSFFADIFRGNCLNIGVLPVQVSAEFLDKIFQVVFDDPKSEIIVSLLDQTVTIVKLNISEPFEINSYKKNNMLNGYDDIDYLVNIKDTIKKFSKTTPL